MSWAKVVIHADLDAFFAAVEERDDPRLAGKPIVVGALPGSRGVVSTASYAARAYGVRSAMPIGTAVALCPHAVFLPVNRDKYLRAAQEVFDVFGRYADRVERVSVDEAYLEATMRAADDPLAHARALKAEVLRRTRLTLSCGVAQNKLVAKVASDADKPDGLVVVPPGEEARYLAPFPVRALPGIGPKNEARLAELGIETAGDLQRITLEHLERGFTRESAEYLQNLAHGRDDSDVLPPEEPKQIGLQQTYQRDLVSDRDVERALQQIAHELTDQVQAARYRARTITVRVRFADFTSRSRSRTLFQATDRYAVISEVAGELLARLRAQDRRPIRLLGLSAQQLERPGDEQLELLEIIGA